MQLNPGKIQRLPNKSKIFEIADKWALTAAHCFYNKNTGKLVITKDMMSVVLGIHNRKTTTDTLRKVVSIAQIIIHPSYIVKTYQNDIALLRFTEAVDLNTYSPACLPTQGADDFTGANAWVYGIRISIIMLG